MNWLLTPKLAWRYLISKKSHSAVGAISVVAIIGMMVATAAIICVLSVFNGFQNSIGTRLDNFSPDILVQPVKGKVFENADSICKRLTGLSCVEYATPTLTENALAIYGTSEMPITLKGVDMATYRKIIKVDSLLIAGDSPQSLPAFEDSTPAYFSIGAASGLHTFPEENVLIFAPRRYVRVNLANPATSFLTDSVYVAAVFQSNQKEYDENYILTDRGLVADILQYDTEASAIEVSLKSGVTPEEGMKAISAVVGKDFTVKDRLRQQEMNFRMIKIEKWITFLLLFLILLIASFNIISSLSMLVLEKQPSLATLRSLGMSRSAVSSIFFWESLYVTAIGGGIGIVIGLGLSFAQQYFGFIKINGDPNMIIMTAYPVLVKFSDVLLTLIPLGIIGMITAWITSSFAKKRSEF